MNSLSIPSSVQLATVNNRAQATSKNVYNIVGRNAVVFVNLGVHTIYARMQLLHTQNGAYVATLAKSGLAIEFKPVSWFNSDDKPIVIMFQTIDYALSNAFRAVGVSLPEQMTELTSNQYFVAMQKNGKPVFFSRKKNADNSATHGYDYTHVPTPETLAFGDYFLQAGNVEHVFNSWVKMLQGKENALEIDKRKAIVNGKFSPFGAHQHSQGKKNKELTDLGADKCAALYADYVKAIKTPILASVEQPTLSA